MTFEQELLILPAYSRPPKSPMQMQKEHGIHVVTPSSLNTAIRGLRFTRVTIMCPCLLTNEQRQLIAHCCRPGALILEA